MCPRYRVRQTPGRGHGPLLLLNDIQSCEKGFHANRNLHFTGKGKRGKMQNKKNILPG
jgi:hypothetical protein